MNCYYVTVITHMGMRICLRWFSMCRPTGMSDTTCSRYRFSIISFICKNFQSAFRFNNLCITFAVANCKSR